MESWPRRTNPPKRVGRGVSGAIAGAKRTHCQEAGLKETERSATARPTNEPTAPIAFMPAAATMRDFPSRAGGASRPPPAPRYRRQELWLRWSSRGTHEDVMAEQETGGGAAVAEQDQDFEYPIKIEDA